MNLTPTSTLLELSPPTLNDTIDYVSSSCLAMTAVLPAMNGEKSLHPFFSKLNGQQDRSGTTSSDEPDGIDGLDGTYDESSNGKRVSKKRKSADAVSSTSKTQRTLEQIVNPNSAIIEGGRRYDSREIPNSCSSDPILTPPRKRRRTSQIEASEDQEQPDRTDDEPRNGTATTLRRPSSPEVIIPASSPLPTNNAAPSDDATPTAPKKMLRLNASGKFSSPPSKNPKADEPAEVAPRRRGRPRKSKEAEKDKHMMTVIPYSVEADLGQRIDRILIGKEQYHREVKVTPKQLRTPRKKAPSKPFHPFFLGKPKDEAPPPKQESPRKASTVTPGKLRKHARDLHIGHRAADPIDSWTSALLKDRLMMKHPGAREPAWPNGEQVHVRGLDKDDDIVTLEGSSFYTRKRKAANKQISVNQSVLSRFATQLRVEEDGELRSDGFREPHPSLRLPQKHLISGHDILNLASKELSTSNIDDSVDELSLSGARQHTSHPAIDTLRKRVASTLTAFDEGSGEMDSWTQKYAPLVTDHVLQPSREMNVLKSWLTSLTITAVEGAAKHELRQSPKPESKPKKPRKRKNKDMDDFLVHSDEEVHDMDELTDPEDLPLLSTERRGVKSVVQSSSDGVKLSNAVLLTGPHGSGKTAAAYAVAKELGFKVFEISPCEKRSGKDVLDKVGDMAENHLVRHHGTESGETSAAEEPSRFDEALQQDLASGRQGKMDTFFKPKTTVKKISPKEQPAKPKVKAIEQLQKAVRKPPKDQQQSLILLEEVDILFKEDKDFWSTVFKLIATSKRPFIMTCNNEDLVPLQAMTLHAILRFSPPPIDLATDYMLLMAAAEGHLIERNAIHALYRAKDSDLRASISELQFWCQMGIGDPRGGLSWIYQRYPPRSDLDEQGRQLRVVSQGSFQHGMGQVPDSRLSDEEQALWALGQLGLDPITDIGWDSMHVIPSETLPALKQFEQLSAALSATDVYTACLDTPTLDTSWPPMTDKARSQYIEGMKLLQADERVRYETLSQELAVVSVLTAQQVAGFAPSKDPQSRVVARISASHTTSHSDSLTRRDFACFDSISLPNDSVLCSTPGLSQSAFDGPLSPITIDIAPYVRSILQHEAALAERHDQLNSIMGDGRNATRARTTRAARSALHGGQRSLTRREKWFAKDLDVASVLATGGKDWPKMITSLDELDSREGTETRSPSAESM